MTANIAVFASGSGSNLQVFIEAQRVPDCPFRIGLMVSDRPDCYAVSRATAAGVPVYAVKPRDFSDKTAYEQAILAELRAKQIDWIVLAGYMRLVGETLLTAYPQRIVNIHPSLLPAFPGKQAVKDALQAGVSETGVTVHFVDEGIDTGPILAQRSVPIHPGDTEESLLARVHQVEHELYPEVMVKLIANRV